MTAGLGLALGGGAVLGAAHLGVLQALHARGLVPEVITGTSAGALVGAAYAAGLSLDEMEDRMLTTTWAAVGRLTLAPRFGLLDSRVLEDTVLEMVGSAALVESLPRRFGAVATDLLTRRAVVLDSGPLGRSLRASIAVPGLFPPVVTGGCVLVDGGVAANLPIEACRRLGGHTVVAVRLRPEWDMVPLVRSRESIARLEQEPATLVIRPDVKGLSQWTLADVPRLIDAGRQAADESLDAAGLSPATRPGSPPGEDPGSVGGSL
ncbi:patatin-like phospholipase family protein [Propionicicella superfundia]|uniref:patatin-like phospholipase family protein n=1 Tax=Propionicicella superfundia TaxID=348582 RepID=UPI0004120DBE|nr:patatin-like phospholipase family protein [Propionicicella superfundia]